MYCDGSKNNENFREKTQSIASQIGQNRHCRYYKNDIKVGKYVKHDYRGERNNVYLISCHSSPFFGRSGPPPLKDQKTSSHLLYNTSHSEVVFWWTIIFFFPEFGLFRSSEEHHSIF